MYKPGEQILHSGLYRCTTCGVMVPVSSGETLPTCPSRCADAIWTFFNEKWTAPPPEIREAVGTFPALDLNGDAVPIPAGATLTDIRLGPEQRENPNQDPNLAAFSFGGRIYFGSAHELLEHTKVVPGRRESDPRG